MTRIETRQRGRLSRRQLLAVSFQAAATGLLAACVRPADGVAPAQSPTAKKEPASSFVSSRESLLGGVFEIQYPQQWHKEGGGRNSINVFYTGEEKSYGRNNTGNNLSFATTVSITADVPFTDRSAYDNVKEILRDIASFKKYIQPLDPTQRQIVPEREKLLPNYEAYTIMARIPQLEQKPEIHDKAVFITWQRKRWSLEYLAHPSQFEQDLLLFNHMLTTFRIIQN